MYDSFNRKINYLRISVTDRCNLRCVYCMPEEGIEMLHHNDVLSFEEIADFTRLAVDKGISKVRITGGEPLVRKGIVRLVEMMSGIEGIKDLSMTTNGILLAAFAQDLRKAGLMRVNVSLDTLDAGKYRNLTRGGKLSDVLNGIHAALDAGLTPVKINCVVQQSSDEPDARMVADYAQKLGIEVRFIHQMSLTEGHFSVVEGGSGGDCGSCNRIRLTANGMVLPCLFGEESFDLRALGAEKALAAAIAGKPACGTFNQKGAFYNIGG